MHGSISVAALDVAPATRPADGVKSVSVIAFTGVETLAYLIAQANRYPGAPGYWKAITKIIFNDNRPQ
jgi:hypothetical protein